MIHKTLSQSKSSTSIKQPQKNNNKANPTTTESDQTLKIMNKQSEKASLSTIKPNLKANDQKGPKDKANSSTLLPLVQINNQASSSKPMTTAHQCEKILQADQNKPLITIRDTNNTKGNNNKIQSNFRKDAKLKVADQRPSLKNPQSILSFQNQVLANNNQQLRGKSRFGTGDMNNNTTNINDNSQSNIVKKGNDNLSQESESGDDEEDNNDLAPKRKIFRKYFGMSQAGKKENRNQPKENQDSYVILTNCLGLSDYHIYGVMDGHGPNGHYVSRYIKKVIEEYFTKEDSYHLNTKKGKGTLTETTISTCLMQHDYSFIKDFYKKLQNELIDEKFDVHYSGSTCVLVFHIEKKIICANTGDSRAIIIKDTNYLDSNNVDKSKLLIDPCYYYEVIELSHDHKPNNPKEKERIVKMGGSVEQKAETPVDGQVNCINEYEEPYRVYIKGETYPGIAVSRSLGDEIAQTIGVTYTPEITVHDLTDAFQYMTLASDGVWEFLSNEKVMQIINPFYIKNDIKTACEIVISQSTAWWKKEDVRIDDITIIIVFLGHVHIKKTTI